MSYVWSYDGGSSVSVTFPSSLGVNYDLSATSPAGSFIGPIAGTGGSLTLTIPDIGGLSVGQYFTVFLINDDTPGAGDNFDLNTFQVGSTTPTQVSATWSYDGAKHFSATFASTSGHTYRLLVGDTTNGTTFADGSGTGTDITISLDTAANATGNYIGAWVSDITGATSAQSSRLFTGGVAGSGLAGGAGGTAPPPFTYHTLKLEIHTLTSTETVDITSIAYEKQQSVRHNQTRSFTVTVPAADTLITTAFTDGYPRLQAGNRKLVVWRDGTVIHHGRIFNVERVGDAEFTTATITSFDPWMELGFDSEGRAGRPVRDSTGNFINPTFNGGGAITAGDLIYQIMVNSQQTGTESDPNPGEGELPVHLGTFSTSVDVSPVDVMDWPILIGDYLQTMLQTGTFDIRMRPVDPAEGLGGYKMVSMSVLDNIGTDRTGTVHFDYFTGSNNAVAARHVEDFATVCNKLYDYLGPRIDQQHWRANITPGSPGTTVDPTVSRARYGTHMQIRVFDSTQGEAFDRPLFMALWNGEARIRLYPRNLLYLTPNPDNYALFKPTDHYDIGDLVTVNTGASFGVTLTATQRVYGYDREWSREGVETVTSLIVSADQE